MKPKDLFSQQSDYYARFRPNYPQALYDFLFKSALTHEIAWDCATGNGQVALKLSERFATVYATDMSEAQLSKALPKSNIHYSKVPAEQTPFPDNFFDLVTVGQALHWFHFDAFFKEVKRVAKPNAVFAAWGYELLHISPEVDAVIFDFYQNTVGKYWSPERLHVENKYATIPMPFANVQSLDFQYETSWQPEHLAGYLNSWSAVQQYKNVNGDNPVSVLLEEVKKYWTNMEWRSVRFPIFLKWAKVHQ